MYYRGAQAAIVVYDITNQDTFMRAKTWVKELQRQASPNIVIALAGNKADLASKRMVEYEVCLYSTNCTICYNIDCIDCRRPKCMLKRTVCYLWKHQLKLQ